MLVLMAVVITPVRSHAAGDANQGAQVFRQCQACHSLEPDRHLTGPSLAHIWGRKAGTARGFHRYSKALKNANVTWNAESLDAWLKNPREFIPRNYMGFAGIENPQARQDLIAYLKVASNEQPSKGDTAQGGGMMGQTGSRPALNLKELTPKQQVEAMRYCGDAYFVTLGSGETFAFWEFNLRFKTDSSQDGPHKGKPAIVRAGMRGDRGFVVFAGPEEISAFIKKQC
ncbi:MAG: c-type cytochrome [Burkholderiales bacterium]|nr:c-type cytochrome [Burkholderiales bacterium]